MPCLTPARCELSAVAALSVCLALASAPRPAFAAGVTLITHGYNGNVTGWVSGMAGKIPEYPSFPGTNYTTYTIVFTYGSGTYQYQWTRTNGAPSATDSGEIVVKLDWSALAGGLFSGYSTYDVANAVSYVLLQTNAISDLHGHALVDYPLHLIGHSRGGSLISEISRVLGSNGVWVDHLTTLDPHPLNNDGFNEGIPPMVDAPVRTYVNVLFHDNYWQDMGNGLTVPNGEPVFGAYQRQLYDLSGGYSSSHSDAHLWYHGTLDWATPTTDNEANLTSAERTNWWVAFEDKGTNAGFLYSLLGGGDRLSDAQPVGAGFPEIRDGFNQWWDLGAGVASNRVAISSNNGAWPNLIRLNRTTTNQVSSSQSVGLKFYYQWAQATNRNATLAFYLDDDFNPLNENQTLIAQTTVPGTTATNVFAQLVALTLDATNAPPGRHTLLAQISAGGNTRYLYAPEWVEVVGSTQPPTLNIFLQTSGDLWIVVHGVPGQTIVLQSSTDLEFWNAQATNTLRASDWTYTNSAPSSSGAQFYRALLKP